jgi:alpha-glucosidase
MGFEAWKRMIDFAHKHEIPYLLLDANWYGPEHSDLSNPFQGGLAAQVKQALEYGKEREVGLILYLNDAASRNYQVEEILEAYASWGAVGIKYGFMKGTGQNKVLKTERVVRACAENQLLVNFHDGPIPPTGHERTWPHWNTREYIHAQTDGHRTHLPGDFVHMAYVQSLAGPVDGNHGLFDYESTGPERPPQFGGLYSTIVAEIARTLVLYSGLTVLPDAPEAYAAHPELFSFITAQKQPWQQSRTLQGEFGKWITTMRQAVDGNFLVATATDEEGREVEVSLEFLPDGRFEATIFEDAEDAHYRTNRVAYSIRKKVVTSSDVISAVLAPGGGHAVLLRPLR